MRDALTTDAAADLKDAVAEALAAGLDPTPQASAALRRLRAGTLSAGGARHFAAELRARTAEVLDTPRCP